MAKNRNIFGSGGVRITTGKFNPETKKVEPFTFYAFMNQNTQCLLEEEATRIFDRDMTLQTILTELSTDYRAKLGRLVMWACLKTELPELTIEQAGEYHINLRVKTQLQQAISNSHLTNAEIEDLCDRIESANDQVMRKQFEAVEEAIAGKKQPARNRKH
jgi:hypothetical protein